MNTSEVGKALEKLFREILNELVLSPGFLKVYAVAMTKSIMLRIEASAGDMGRIIGEKGAHFKSLRAICGAVGHKFKVDIELPPLPESRTKRADRYEKFQGRDDWKKEKITDLIRRAAVLVFRHEEAVEVSVADLPDFISTYTVSVATAEPALLVEAMSAALKILFNAVGKANGRTLIVEVVPSNMADPPQPAASDGRSAKETRR